MIKFFNFKNHLKIFILLLSAALSLSNNIEISKCIAVIYGDTRTGYNIHKKLIDLIYEEKPKAVFNTGDLVSDGRKDNEWIIFNEIISKLVNSGIQYYSTTGNHEKESNKYYDNFTFPNNEKWYSIDIDKIHFIILNSSLDLKENSEQYSWLVNDLADVKDDIKFKIVIFHHPLFTSSYHQADEKKLSGILLPIFQKYKVNAVFNGHNHLYEKYLYNNIYFIVTGGGGAPLYDPYNTDNPYFLKSEKTYHYCRLNIKMNKLIIEVIDINSSIIDKIIIK